MRKLIYLLAACLAVGLVAAGCGGGDDSTSTSTAALTKQEFVKQADAICAKGNKEIDKAGSEQFGKGQKPSQAEQEKFATDTVIPNVQNQVTQVGALTPPKGDEDQVNQIVDDAQAAVDTAKKDPSLLTESAKGDPFAKVNKETKAYGLDKC